MSNLPPLRHRYLVYSSLAAALSAVIASGAAAQERAQPVLEEITVTAQFREQDLQTTPLSITAVTGEMLEARGQMNIADVAAQSPNVQLKLNPAGQGNSMRAYIRGVGQSDQSIALDPGVGVYIDDVYYATLTGSALALIDVDRVEVLRGPQGTLAGMNSLGGAVKLFSRKPDGDGGAYVEGVYGTYDRTDINAAADMTIMPEKMFLRLSGASRHRDGHVKLMDYACVHPDDPYVQSGAILRGNSDPSCQIGTLGGQSLSALRGALRWLPSDTVEVNLAVDTTHDRSESQATVLRNADELIPGASLVYQGVPYDNRFTPYGPNRGDTVLNDPYVSYANFFNPGVTATPIDSSGTPGPENGPYDMLPVNYLDGWGTSATIDWAFSDNLSLKAITGYREYEAISGHDNDASPVAILGSQMNFGHEQYTQELRLSGSAGDFVDYTVGAIYFRQDTNYRARVYSPYNPTGSPTLKTFDFLTDDTTENRSSGLFAHAAWYLTDQLTLSTGVRYTEQDKDYTFYRLNIDGQTPFLPLSNPDKPLNGTTGNFEGSHTDYRLNLAYQLTPDVMAYAQYATGFKGGGVSPRPYYPEQVRGFGMEEVEAYEFGLKSRLLDDRMDLNFAVFYNDYQDYQAAPLECVDENGEILPPPFDAPCGQYANVADAEVKGAEIELLYYPIPGMQINASYSYLDFEFQEPFIETNSVIAGASAPGIGENTGSVGAQHEFMLPGGASLTPRVDVVYTPGYCGNLNCTELARNESYTLVNARLTFRTPNEDWRLALEAMNLTDEYYALNKFSTPIGYANDHVGMPRTWSLYIRRSF